MHLRNATIALLFSTLLYSPLFLFSKPEGFEIDARVTGYPFPGEGSCAQSDCHGDGMGANRGMGNIAISINGEPASSYAYRPGETVPVRVTITEPSSQQQRFGFQITSRTPDGCSQAGMFSMAADPNLVLFLDNQATAPCQPEPIQFATHGLAKAREAPNVAPVAFDMNWTAPPTDIGPIVFAAAGNAANGDMEETGDNIYTTGATIEPAGIGAPAPSISAVLNNATNLLEEQPGSAVAPGSGISIYGQGFAAHLPVPSGVPLVSSEIPLETTLGDLTVTIDGVVMPIFGVFRGEDRGDAAGFDQINGQLPWEVIAEAKSTATMLITSGGVTSEPREISVEPASPGIYSWGLGPGPGIVTNFTPGRLEFAQAPGTFCASFGLPQDCIPTDAQQVPTFAEAAAPIGGIITVWANGLGRLTGMVASGDIPEPGAPILFTEKTVRVLIDGIEAQILGGGAFLQPQFVGLNQINAVVPVGVTPGDAVPIVIEVDCGDGTVFRSREDVTIAVAAPAP